MEEDWHQGSSVLHDSPFDDLDVDRRCIVHLRRRFFVVLLLFVLVVPFEKLFPRHKGQKIRRPHLDTDIGYALASPLLGLLTGFVAIVVGILSLAGFLVCCFGRTLIKFLGIHASDWNSLFDMSSIGRTDSTMKFSSLEIPCHSPLN